MLSLKTPYLAEFVNFYFSLINVCQVSVFTSDFTKKIYIKCSSHNVPKLVTLSSSPDPELKTIKRYFYGIAEIGSKLYD